MTDETKMSSEEQDSQETSAEANAPADESVKEPTVPLHEVTKIRSRAQAAELKAANLEGQLTALQQTTVQTEKSPMEIEVAKQAEEGIAEEDMTITPALYRRQQAFEKQQTEQATTASTEQTRSAAQLASRGLAIAAHDDWQQVVNEAVKHMTKGEQLDLSLKTDDFGETIYAKSQEVLKRVNSVKSTAPENKPSEQEAKEKKEAEEKKIADEKKAAETPSQKEILANASPAAKAAFNL